MTEVKHNNWPYRDQLGVFILDILHYDYESIPHLIHGLNGDALGWRDCWPHEFTIDEIIPELESLMHRGLVIAYHEDDPSGKTMSPAQMDHIADSPGDLHGLWFGLSEKGWVAWRSWRPPIDDEGEPVLPDPSTPPGLTSDLGKLEHYIGRCQG